MAERYLAAASLLLFWLILCLHTWIAHRRRTRQALAASTAAGAQAQADASTTVIAYASQTGVAEDIATRTAQSLDAAGIPTLILPLSLIDAPLLAQDRHILFIVSTTGEGDAPDSASSFTSQLMANAGGHHGQLGASSPFGALHYAVLALGDQEYTHFCQFGKTLDAWLHSQGAHSLFDRIEVNNGDTTALQRWQRQVAQALRAPDLPAWQSPTYGAWQLTACRLLNPGNEHAPCFHLVLQPCNGALPDWQAGDIAEISIPQPTSDNATPALREYSIASLPSEGAIHLLVRQMRSPDGNLGLASGWLTTQLRPGDTLSLRIRTNRNFHAPEPDRGLILIGNGTGLAGLRAHLKARADTGNYKNWLVFGERTRKHDYYFQHDIETWQQRGALQRLDLAFSRDQTDKVYVQHHLRQAATNLRAWVEQGAAIYVCGSLKGMAQDVHHVLTETLGPAQLQQLIDTGRYRRDVY
ncbi:sulfite reductase subunit alpha [Allopusillimonas ginsengisoli]|uniref:sulfite reductase subunit alpha n=1 Tax=Allopusillimonas ginsengisoli TaxID=453575 RepID=UPI00102270F2|nr:sulfite reductase subunit alpha [Allopusillimonas ginsengisoli]TEA77166.1 oxidoreductase [Allopusillimonas ginsengisoli]